MDHFRQASGMSVASGSGPVGMRVERVISELEPSTCSRARHLVRKTGPRPELSCRHHDHKKLGERWGAMHGGAVVRGWLDARERAHPFVEWSTAGADGPSG